MIAVHRFESPHTVERISKSIDKIVEEWHIPYHKILTDNGSNMVPQHLKKIEAYKMLKQKS